MRKLTAVLCLLMSAPFISHAEESENNEHEQDITVAEAAAEHKASGQKCEPNHSTAVGIVMSVEEGAETPVMISPISVKSTYTLSKGAPVLWNSRIVTTGNSRVTILLADNTTVSVGPNSQLQMDGFVFDPCKTMTATGLLKGVARAVGGKITPVKTENNPTTSTMGVRG